MSILPSASFMRKSWLRRRGVALEHLRSADVGAVGLLEAGLDGVGEVRGQDLVVDAGFGGRVADGEGDFAALEEIARHPVGRAEVDFVVAAVGEVEDAGVLEEAADNRADANAVGQPLDARAQNAEAADDEVDLDAGLEAS